MSKNHEFIPANLLITDAQVAKMRALASQRHSSLTEAPTTPVSSSASGSPPVQRVYRANPPALDPVGEIYEKARFQKLYGIDDDLESMIPASFFAYLDTLQARYPTEEFTVLASHFLRDDLNEPRSGGTSFLDNMRAVFFYNVRLELDHRRSDRITVKIRITGNSLRLVVKHLGFADIVHIFSAHTPRIGFYTATPLLAHKLAPEIGSLTAHYVRKGKVHNHFSPPDVEVFSTLAPDILSWIYRKRATTVRAIYTKPNHMELRFYRNRYQEGQRLPLFYTDESVLQAQIARGAFAWVADSHYETVNLTPKGPYLLTIDLDPLYTMEYSEIVARLHDFLTFCRDQIAIDPWIVHSGNTSFHVKIPVADFPSDDPARGILLPKLVSWETYYRRRQHELPMLLLRDAMTLLTVAYNHWTSLPPVACNVKKFSHLGNFGIRFDNRTGIHQGARVPGSWHHKSGRMCRLFSPDHLPTSEAELHALTSVEYVATHPTVVRRPSLPSSVLMHNLEHVLEFTTEYYSRNQQFLLYEAKIFND